MADLFSSLIGKKVAIEATFPVPNSEGGISFPTIEGTLIEIGDDHVAVRREGSSTFAFFFKANIRSINQLSNIVSAAAPPIFRGRG